MIIVQLKGGLGNQLFQYAAALSLGHHHGVEVKVDEDGLNAADEGIGTVRHYELQHLINPPAIATTQEIVSVKRMGPVERFLQKLLPSYNRTVYNEKQFEYDPHFFDAGKHIYLKGYRQSERYFKPIEPQVRADFRLKPGLLEKVAEAAACVQSEDSVAVHIRRGDYTNKAVLEHHGILPAEYYQRAITTIQVTVDQPVFYVFSDNVEWVKQNLQFDGKVRFASGEISNIAYEDFYLMSRCKHNIIANSSFSWWAAYLNANPRKTVIAPSKWFNKPNLNTKDLIPEGWLRL